MRRRIGAGLLLAAVAIFLALVIVGVFK